MSRRATFNPQAVLRRLRRPKRPKLARRQSALPEAITAQPIEPGFSYGFSDSQEMADENHAARTPLSQQPTLIRNPNHKMVSSSRTVANSIITIVGASAVRRYLLIQNVGAVTVFLGFNTSPNVNGINSIEIPAGVQISFEDGIVPNTAIEAICATQTTLSILEGVEI